MIDPASAFAARLDWACGKGPSIRRVIHVVPLHFLEPRPNWLVGGLTLDPAMAYYQYLVASAVNLRGPMDALSATSGRGHSSPLPIYISPDYKWVLGSASLAMDDGLPDLVAPPLVERVAQDYALHRVQANLGDLPPALRASITEAINNEPSAKESLARLAAAQRCDDIFRGQREECERREIALANRLHAIGKIEPME